MLRWFLLSCCLFALTACTTAPRYVVDTPKPAQIVSLRLSTIEVRDMVLPGHASGSEVLIETASGALEELGGAIWADDPVRAHTATLARALDVGSSATVAAEPWPLQTPAQAQLIVRVDRMLAHSDGTFTLEAQVAVTSPDQIVRERIDRISITTGLPSADASGVATATGTALQILADRILSTLAK